MVRLHVNIPKYFDPVMLHYILRFVVISHWDYSRLTKSSRILLNVQFRQYYHVFVCTISGIAFLTLQSSEWLDNLFPHICLIFLISFAHQFLFWELALLLQILSSLLYFFFQMIFKILLHVSSFLSFRDFLTNM